MKSKVFFYSSVRDKKLFNTQRFYQIDIDLIKNLGYEVHVTNRIADFLFFWKYDISFIYFYRKGLFPAIISKLFLKRVFFTGGIDDLNESTTTPKNYFVQKVFFKLCNLISNNSILVSTSDQDNVRKIYNGKLPKNTSLSFHTIDVEKFIIDDDVKKDFFFTSIAWMESIGNVKRKGVDKAIYLFKMLIERMGFLDAKFYIIGKEGVGSDYLKKICVELGISEKVIFTGSIDESLKIDFLKRSKYYFQLSTFEGFGIAALEALSSRNIVIHSGKGGLNGSIGNNGIIVDLKKDLNYQVEDLLKQLSEFNLDKLKTASIEVYKNYSNIRRQRDFEIIFKNKINVKK